MAMTNIYHTIEDAVATTVGPVIGIEGARKVTFQFIRTNHDTGGKTVFSVEASLDGTTYTTYSKLISNTANTNQQNLTRVASYDTGAADTSALYSMDLVNDCIKYIRVTATETANGTHNAWVYVEY